MARRVRVVSAATADSTGAVTHQTPATGVADFENIACGSWTARASKEGFGMQPTQPGLPARVWLKSA